LGTCASCFTYGGAAGINLSAGIVCLTFGARRTGWGGRNGPVLGFGVVAVATAGSTGLLCTLHGDGDVPAASMDLALGLATISAVLPLVWLVATAWSHQEDDDRLPVAVFHLLVTAVFALNRCDAMVIGGAIDPIGPVLVQPLVLPAVIVGSSVVRLRRDWAQVEALMRGMHLVDRATRVMGAADDPAPGVNTVLAMLGPWLGATAAAVVVSRADGGEHYIEWRAPLAGSGSVAVLHRVTGKTPGASRRTPTAFEPTALRGHTVLSTPLVADGATWGALWLVVPESRIGAHPQRDTLERLARAIGQAAGRSHRLVEHRATAVAGERDRIARELHDSVSQTLYSVAMVADGLPRVVADDPEAARRQAGQIRSMTLTALSDLRELLVEMRQSRPEATGLGAMLEQMFGEPDGLVAVEVEGAGEPSPPDAVRLAVHRIARQAVINARRHAGPSAINVRLRQRGGALELTVTDDGEGFEPAAVGSDHHGLAIMRERAASVDGDLTIDSAPSTGTTVRFRWATPSLPPPKVVEL
jgi:signal transduction histidine kinase